MGVNRMALAAAVEEWLSGQRIAGYHGSRLTEEEVERVRAEGLRTLSAADRRERLEAAMSVHPDWATKGAGLAQALEDYGPRRRAGGREGQAHLTLSRSVLRRSFNHYLTHGSEFDQKVAYHLLGDEGFDLLGTYGLPVLFTVAVPGAIAIEAANPYGRRRDEEPSLVRQVVTLWCAWLARPEWTGERYRPDCGIVFRQPVPAEWIVAAEMLEAVED
jgi:hypothetical protein